MSVTFIVPYACGLRDGGRIDYISEKRCKVALNIAKATPHSVIVLGAGMPEFCQKYKVSSLAEAMTCYFKEQGWPPQKMILNPKGYETAGETAAVIEVINDSRNVIAVTSWYHALRVWVVWRLGFHKYVKVVSSPARISTERLVINFLAIPYSLWTAFHWNRMTEKAVKKRVLKRLRRS